MLIIIISLYDKTDHSNTIVMFHAICQSAQNVLHNFEIARAQFANFWLKRDANHNPNPTLARTLTII